MCTLKTGCQPCEVRERLTDSKSHSIIHPHVRNRQNNISDM